MRKWALALVLPARLLLGATAAHAAVADKDALEDSADALMIGIPAAALGLTFLLDDASPPGNPSRRGFDARRMTGESRHDLGLALLRTGIATYGLKAVVSSKRPNGEGGSFPSGHTATTFAGAEFIRKEYGWHWGAPAYLAAGFVGWSRVETEDHWWRDVIAGAAIGFASNHDLSDLPALWGQVNVRPSLLTTQLADAPEPHQEWWGAPGLKLELRF